MKKSSLANGNDDDDDDDGVSECETRDARLLSFTPSSSASYKTAFDAPLDRSKVSITNDVTRMTQDRGAQKRVM